jgi:transposase
MSMGREERYMPSEIYIHDFGKLSRREKNGRVRIRLLGLYHIQQGRTYQETANILQVEVTAPKQWVKRLGRGGLAGIQEQSGRGRKRKLKVEEHDRFCKAVEELQRKRVGGRIRAKDIQGLLEEEFNIHYALSSVYNTLHEAGMSWITGRSQHPKADVEMQETFKKSLKRR